MSSIPSKMSQKLHISGLANGSEHSVMRYGQIVIYLAVIGVISFLYIFAQKILLNYIDNLALGQLPNY